MVKRPRTWATRFIRRLAAELDGEELTYIDWEKLANWKHLAMANVLTDVIRGGTKREKRAAASIIGDLKYLSDDAGEVLSEMIRDRSADVRLAAAWAFGGLGESAGPFLDDFIEAVDDQNEAVRYAAIWSLGRLSSTAAPAVSRLMELVRTTWSAKLRDVGIKALSEIEPERPDVQAFLTVCLSASDDHIAFQATVGLGRANRSPADAHPLIVGNFNRDDGHIAIASAWALGRLIPLSGVGVPELLSVMSRRYEMPVLMSELDPNETFEIHSGFVDELTKLLPTINDNDLSDYRVRFFRSAFHPNRATLPNWVTNVSRHPWIERMIRSRVRRQFSFQDAVHDKQTRAVLLGNVEEEFVERLLKDPLLGVTSAQYANLPGNVRNHIHKIAWRLANKRYRSVNATGGPIEVPAIGMDPTESAIAEDLVQQIRSYIASLPFDMAEVLGQRLFQGKSVEAIAKDLGIKEWRIKELFGRGLAMIRRRFPYSDF